MAKTVTITIRVTYDESTVGEDIGRFARLLEYSVDSACQFGGMLSPDHEITNDWDIIVDVD